MRRNLSLICLATLIMFIMGAVQQSQSAVAVNRLSEQAVTQSVAQDDRKDMKELSKECLFNGLNPADWTVNEIKQTIKCAVAKWSVPGGFTKALSVARCESGPDLRDTTNPSYIGTYQQSRREWGRRRAFWNPPTWDNELKKFGDNPRSNVVVSIRMAHADQGWDHWEMGSCA